MIEMNIVNSIISYSMLLSSASVERYSGISNVHVFVGFIVGITILGVIVKGVLSIKSRIELITKLEEYTGNTVGEMTACKKTRGIIEGLVMGTTVYVISVSYVVDNNKYFITTKFNWPKDKALPKNFFIKYSAQNPAVAVIEFRRNKYTEMDIQGQN